MFSRVVRSTGVSTLIAAFLWVAPSLSIAGSYSPSDVKAIAVSTNEVRISWVDNTRREMGFRIARSILPSSDFRTVAEVARGEVKFADKTVQPNTTYYYKVRAFRGDSRTDWSEAVTVTTPAASQPPANPRSEERTS